MSPPSAAPFVGSVAHPTDFSEAGEGAFAHALAIALVQRASFTILHGDREYIGEDAWVKFPPVRRTLERWGLLDPGSARRDVFDKLAMSVKKVNVRGSDPLGAVNGYLANHPTDLIVLATEGREGLARFLRPSAAAQLARRSRTRTLFVPKGARGFVSPEDGSTSLRRILVPVDRQPDPDAALVYASHAAKALGDEPVEISVLHVGSGSLPRIDLPEDERCRWSRIQRSGAPAEQILAASRELESDLIIMTTEGREGIIDALRGSVTDQVVRGADCPVLAVPEE